MNRFEEEYTEILRRHIDSVCSAEDAGRVIRIPTCDDKILIGARVSIGILLTPILAEHYWSCLKMQVRYIYVDDVEVSSNNDIDDFDAAHSDKYKVSFSEYISVATRVLNNLIQKSLEHVQVGGRVDTDNYLVLKYNYNSQVEVINLGLLEDGSQLLFAESSNVNYRDDRILVGSQPYTRDIAETIKDRMTQLKSIFV